MSFVNSDNDKFNNKFSYAPPVVFESAFPQIKDSLCHVQAPPIPPDTIGLQGTADLYELTEGVFTIATSRVNPVTDANFLVNTVFTFDGIGQIRLREEEIKFCSTNRELDAIVIELTEDGVNRLKQFGAKLIRVSTTTSGGDKCPEGEFCIDIESIQEINLLKINQINNEVYYGYYVGSSLNSNVSPILLWDYRAIAMNNQTGTTGNGHRALLPIRNGNRLLAIAVYQILRYY